MANNDKENKIEKFTKEAIGKTLNQFNKEIGMADLVEINKNQDRILNGILSQVNDENTEKTEKSNIITLDNSTDGIVELKEIQGDTNVNVSKIEEMPITHDIGDKEGNVFTLNEIPKGAISIGEIQGNTMVNCNKDDKKELVLMKDLSTQGDNNIDITEGVDGGLVDVALEGNTLVNVSKTKDSTAITKAYTVENSGNHIALQGDVDGSCRPVITGNTLVNLASNSNLWEVGCSGDVNTDYTITSTDDQGIVVNKLTDNVDYFYLRKKIDIGLFKPSTTYTIIFNSSKAYRVGIVSGNTAETALPLLPCNDGYNTITVTSTDFSTVTGTAHIYAYLSIDKQYIGTAKVSDFIVLEGDYTDRPIPDYFEGLQSSFEDRVVPERLAHFPSTILTTPSSGYTYREFGDTLSLKPSTTYTIVQKAHKTTNHSPVNTNARPYTLVFGGRQGVSDSWIVRANPPVGDIKEGVSAYTLTTPNDFVISIQTFMVIVEENRGSEFELEVSIFEGDYTNYNFSDYDPTKVGKYRVDYKVTGKNKAYGLKQQIPDVLTTKINVTKGKSYTYSTQNIADGTCRISICDSEPYNNESLSNAEIQLISDWGGGNHTWVSEVTGTVWFIIWQRDITINSNSTLQIEEGTTSTSYEPYKEYTKTLYLNSPLLEGDTIEQYGNNIVHVHKYGKVVLDGGTSPWGNRWWESTSNTTDTVFSGGLSSAPYEDISYCDKLPIVTPSNLSSYNTAITIDGESIIRVNIPKTLLSGNKDLSAFRTWLNANPITLVGKLKTPTYELIEQSNLTIPSYANGHLDLASAVPIEKVEFLPFTEELTYLYATTQYTIQFNSDKAIAVDINLGGTQLLAQDIVQGLNRISITTPSELVDNRLIINGAGANISEVVVTNTDREFRYFEGMKSVGEGNGIEILSHNGNLYKRLENSYYKIYGSSVVVVEDNEDSFIFEVNDWDKGISYLISTEGLFKNKKYKLTWEKYNELAIPQLHASGITLLNSNKRVKEQISFEKISNVDWNFELPDSFEQGDILEIRFKTSIASGQNGACNICINEVGVAKNTALSKLNKQQITHEPLRAVGDIKDKYVLIDGKWYIERNCAEANITKNVSLFLLNDATTTNYTVFGYTTVNKPSENNLLCICDKLPASRANWVKLLSEEKEDVQVYSNNRIFIKIANNKLTTLDENGFKTWLQQNPLTAIYPLQTPQYEPIDYNPFEVYSEVTHISNNSTIPCNMTIKNTGYNCLLKPSTTYTVSSNLGLNTVTTPSVLSEDCLRFYDTDTSTVTTMNNVTILEGDYTTGKPLPAHFSGIESAFEQELVTDENDVNYGKYKVTTKVVGKNLLGTKVEAFLGRPYGNDIYTFQQHPNADVVSYIIPCLPNTTYSLSSLGDRNVMAEFNHYPINGDIVTNVYGRTITTSNTAKWLVVYINSLWTDDDLHAQLEEGNTATAYEPYKENNITFYLNEPLRRVEDSKDRVFIQDDKVIVERKCGSATFDGSDDEGWVCELPMQHTIYAICIFNSIKGTELINNKVPSYNSSIYSKDIEGMYTTNDQRIKIKVSNSKLQTQDVVGFRQWLQQNPVTVVYQLAEPTYEEVEYSSNRLILDTFNNESFNNSTLFLDTNISPKLSFKPLWEELVYVKNSTKYYIQFNAVGSGEVVINLGGTELTTEIVEGYNYIPITTPSESTNLMTIIGQGITISEVVVSEVVCGGYYKGLQSCFEEHMENGKYRVLLRGIALDGSKVNGIKLYINEPLRGVENVKDRLCIKNGKLMVERKCGEIKLDENSNIISLSGLYLENTVIFKLDIPIKNYDYYICDNFECYYSMSLSNKDVEGTYSFDNSIRFRILRSKLNGESYKDFKQWLQDNPTTVVYQLAEPVYEEATNEYGLPIVFEGYENGIVYIDSAVTPTTHIKYTSNNQLATTLSEAEEQNIATQEDINMNVVTYMMDIDMILTEMEMSNDTSVMAVRRDSSNENMLDRMSDEDKKVYRDNTVVMLEKMITANVLEKEDIEGRIDMYYNKNRISKEQYEYLKSLL